MDMKTIRIILPLLILSMTFSACGPRPQGQASVAKSNLQRVAAPDVPTNDLTTLVNDDNAFAFNLYQSLLSKDGNLVLSPYSISLALAMTYAGARGETESQMAKALHFSLSQERLHPAFNQLDMNLTQESQTTSKDQQPLQLNIANAVWAEQTYPFLQAYLDLIAQNYGAGIHLADFINQFEQARMEINNWVSDQTKEKIQNLIPNGALNANTRMVLVNAIYFKADWQEQFDPNNTTDAPFHLLDGSQVQVKTMSDTLHVPYVKGNGYQAVELPYQGNSAAMDILVPDEGNFDQFESTMDFQKMNEVLSSVQNTAVMLSLPKLTFNSEFNLSHQLAALGMPDAFDGNKADFSGMTGEKDLFVSDVVHKADISVDEKGTEAAAATGVIMEATSAMVTQVNLKIDRPFLFVIRDLKSGQILFMGRVLNPAH